MCWRKVLWWCWWWVQQRWVSVWAGAWLPGVLGLGSFIIKMAIAFQFPGTCIDLGRGVGQCLHYHMEWKMHKVLASVLGRQQWLIVQVSGRSAGETSWCRNSVLSIPVTETLLNELCSAHTPAFLVRAFDPSHCFLLPQPLCTEQCLSCLEIFLSGLAEVYH